MSDETPEEERSANASEAGAAPAIDPVEPPEAGPRLSPRPSAPPAFAPPNDDAWGGPPNPDEEPEPPTPRSQGVEPRAAPEDATASQSAPRPRASVIPLPGESAARVSGFPRAPAVPEPLPPLPPLPSDLHADPEDDDDGRPTEPEVEVSTRATATNGAEVSLARDEDVASSDGEPEPPEPATGAALDRVEAHADDPGTSPKDSQAAAAPPPPKRNLIAPPPIVDSEDLGVSEDLPKSLKPMRIISIGTSQPPQPEKRRSRPPEAIAKLLAPLNLPIDEAPDIEVEVSIADDDEPESVEEIQVDPEEAYPQHAIRSRPPPPPARSRTSDAPPVASKSDLPAEAPATPAVATSASPGVASAPAGNDASVQVTTSETEESPVPSTVEEPAEEDVAPASEYDAIEEAEPEPAKPPPPPKRRQQVSQPAVQEIEPPKAEKKRAKPWWEDLFTEDFARGSPLLTDAQLGREAAFIEDSLGVARGGTVLDLACGVGQHAVELARRGYGMVGFDLSLPQLAMAGELAQARGQKLNFMQGDMREMSFEESFDGIYCWNTSFGYFEEEKNFAVVQRIFRALRSGGSFLLDVVNRDFVAAQQPSSVWFEGDGCVCMDDMSVDFITSRLKVKRTIMMDDGRTRECGYSIRIYSLHELGKMLHDVGFRVTEASGHPAYPGVFFGATSPRVIILAQKP